MANTMSPEAWQAYLNEDCSWFPFRCSIAAIIMVVVAYAGRFWARSLQAAPWGWFDWFMIPSFLGTLGTSVCGILISFWGSGRHIEWFYYQPDAVLDRWGIMAYYVCATVYMAGIAFPRFSILCLYGRLFRDKTSKVGIYLVLFLLWARIFAETPILWLQCKHYQSAWRIERWAPDCSSGMLRHYTYSRIPNIVADVIMLVLPLRPLAKLKLAFDVKLGIMTTFSLGAFGLATAVIGFAAFLGSMDSFDQSWVNSGQIAWSVLEPAVYFTSACMLTYKPLIRSMTKMHTIRSLISNRRSLFVDPLEITPPNSRVKEQSLPSSTKSPTGNTTKTTLSSGVRSPVMVSFDDGNVPNLATKSYFSATSEARSPAAASFNNLSPMMMSPTEAAFSDHEHDSPVIRSPAAVSFRDHRPAATSPTSPTAPSSRSYRPALRSPTAVAYRDDHPPVMTPRSHRTGDSQWFHDNDSIQDRSHNQRDVGDSWLQV